MDATTETAISIRKELFDQAEILAQQFNISPSHLVELALENLIKNHPSQTLLEQINKTALDQSNPHEQTKSPDQEAKTAAQIGGWSRRINQGDIYWVQLADPKRSEPGYPHPHVIIQDDVITHSRINTVVVCGLTSNRKRVTEPGNVLLDIGEANLPKQSVMLVSQISTVDKTQLGAYIGSLSKQRVNQILAGMRFQQLSFFARYNNRVNEVELEKPENPL